MHSNENFAMRGSKDLDEVINLIKAKNRGWTKKKASDFAAFKLKKIFKEDDLENDFKVW
jgi:hypothetical protein